MNVWVLYGEDTDSSVDLAYEVRRMVAEAQKMDVNVEVFRPQEFDLLITEENRDSILVHGQHRPLPDIVFPYLAENDRNFFSFAVIRQLRQLGVPVLNNEKTIEKVGDKLHTHQILAREGLPTPTTLLAKFPVNLELVEKHVGFPVVVKTRLGSNGSGVFLIEHQNAFSDLMNLIEETNPNIQLIFQKFVSFSKGRDLRLFVVDGHVVAAMERRAKEGDFKANYSTGGTVQLFEPDAEAVDLALRTSEILNIDIAGVDLLFSEEGYTICEANTFPGFKGLEQATGENIPRYIFEAMQRRLGLSGHNPHASTGDIDIPVQIVSQ
mgnify:CR=1 FL=1